MSAKTLIKKFIPPVFLELKNKLSGKKDVIYWHGRYKNWDEAKKKSKGYADEIILEKCKNALLAVKNGHAVAERDGILLNQTEYSWPVVAVLQKSAIENDNNLCVLDFGGSLGTSYFQNRLFLDEMKSVHWCIVEQPHFVACGKEHFENHQLHFFSTIEECLQKFTPQVVLLSGVLPYLEQPFVWLDKFLQLGIRYFILDRVLVSEDNEDIISVQHISKDLYEASYPLWIFNRTNLLKRFLNKYELIAEFTPVDKQSVVIDGRNARYSGMLFSTKNLT